MRTIAVLAAVLFILAPAARAETYEIDPVHSQVSFRIRHLVAKLRGRFNVFSGTVVYAPGKPETWKTEATIDPASINTDNVKRDDDLRSANFFDVAQCPAMGFKSTKVTGAKGAAAKLHGELTIHCVTKPVVLDLELGGVAADPWGGRRAGFAAKTTLSRKDFGIVYNKVLDNGGVLIGDEVEVSIDIEAVAKAEAPAKK